MKEVRYGAAGSMREKGLLITGGYNRSTWLSSNEYSSSDVWKSGPPIPVPISHNCQITVGSGVYVIGRYTGVGFSSNMDIYRR